MARFAVRRFEFQGIDIKTRQTRWYPNGDLAVHALGYVGAISEQDLKHIDRAAYSGTALIGKLGVESAFEDALHGKNGFREVLVNAQGRSVERQGAFVPNLRTRAPAAGEDILLSVDLKLQRAAEDALAGHRGAVVAIDPTNGDVLALVSLPDFDPNLFARGITSAEYSALANDIDRPLFNRALRGVYPPGSTMKPAMALAALTYHVVDPQAHRYCAGQFHLPGSSFIYREYHNEHHGYVDLDEAMRGLVRRVLLRARRRARHRPHRRVPRAVRLRLAHGHRHRRREARHPSFEGMEGEGLRAARRSRLVPG